MREPQSKMIDGVEYVVTPLGASQGLKVMTMLARMLGPAIANMKTFNGAMEALALGLGAVAEQLNDADLDAICRAMAASTVVKLSAKKQPQLSSMFELHFAGEYFAMFEWLRFALEVNFESFFCKAREAMAAEKPESPVDLAKGKTPSAE